VGQFFISSQDTMALGIEDGSMTSLVFKKGNQAGLELSEETGSNTGVYRHLVIPQLVTVNWSQPIGHNHSTSWSQSIGHTQLVTFIWSQ